MTFTPMNELANLNKKERLDQLKSLLFYPVGVKDDRPVVFKYLLFKVALIPGSAHSIDFHQALGELDTNVVFTSESI